MRVALIESCAAGNRSVLSKIPTQFQSPACWSLLMVYVSCRHFYFSSLGHLDRTKILLSSSVFSCSSVLSSNTAYSIRGIVAYTGPKKARPNLRKFIRNQQEGYFFPTMCFDRRACQWFVVLFAFGLYFFCSKCQALTISSQAFYGQPMQSWTTLTLTVGLKDSN